MHNSAVIFTALLFVVPNYVSRYKSCLLVSMLYMRGSRSLPQAKIFDFCQSPRQRGPFLRPTIILQITMLLFVKGEDLYRLIYVSNRAKGMREQKRLIRAFFCIVLQTLPSSARRDRDIAASWFRKQMRRKKKPFVYLRGLSGS